MARWGYVDTGAAQKIADDIIPARSLRHRSPRCSALRCLRPIARTKATPRAVAVAGGPDGRSRWARTAFSTRRSSTDVDALILCAAQIRRKRRQLDQRREALIHKTAPSLRLPKVGTPLAAISSVTAVARLSGGWAAPRAGLPIMGGQVRPRLTLAGQGRSAADDRFLRCMRSKFHCCGAAGTDVCACPWPCPAAP